MVISCPKTNFTRLFNLVMFAFKFMMMIIKGVKLLEKICLKGNHSVVIHPTIRSTKWTNSNFDSEGFEYQLKTLGYRWSFINVPKCNMQSFLFFSVVFNGAVYDFGQTSSSNRKNNVSIYTKPLAARRK